MLPRGCVVKVSDGVVVVDAVIVVVAVVVAAVDAEQHRH